MTTKLISRKAFMDYDVTGIGDIHRAAVPYGIKIGQLFNVNRGVSKKNSAKWMGNLEYSLLKFAHDFDISNPTFKDKVGPMGMK